MRPFFVIGSVQRDGQFHRHFFFRHADDAGNNTACRNRNFPFAEIAAVFVAENTYRFTDFIEIAERLSHTHEDNMTDRTVFLSDADEFFDDFGRRQIPLESAECRMAKAATHGTSDLCRKACCSSSFVCRQCDRFDNGIIGKAKSDFDCPVARYPFFQNFRGQESSFLF